MQLNRPYLHAWDFAAWLWRPSQSEPWWTTDSPEFQVQSREDQRGTGSFLSLTPVGATKSIKSSIQTEMFETVNVRIQGFLCCILFHRSTTADQLRYCSHVSAVQGSCCITSILHYSKCYWNNHCGIMQQTKIFCNTTEQNMNCTNIAPQNKQ